MARLFKQQLQQQELNSLAWIIHDSARFCFVPVAAGLLYHILSITAIVALCMTSLSTLACCSRALMEEES